MAIIVFILSVAAAYLIGSIPTSYLLTKRLAGIDIRTAGSGNAGATNVLRVVGKAPAVATLVIDILKGVAAVTILPALAYPLLSETVLRDFYVGFLALAVVAGHIWSCFLRFRGGKGVATTLGVAIALTPLALMPALLAWLAVFIVSRYVSLASIIALLVFPIAVLFVNYSFYTVVFAVIICGIGIYKHRSNIERILKGEEHKTEIFSKKEKQLADSVSVEKSK